MKKRRKTLVSCLLALTMLLGMTANCLAANTLTITTVEILDENGRAKEKYAATDTIGVQIGAEIIRVTGKLTDENGSAVSGGAATYLAYDASVDTATDDTIVLDNSTIEYIDQMTTNSDGTVSFTYRNRSIESLPAGTVITAKAGGTDVEKVASTSYTLETDLPILTLTKGEGSSFSFTQTKAEADANYTLTSNTYDTVEEAQVMRLPAAITLKVGSDTVAAENYTYASGALTIKKDFLNSLAAGTHTLTVQAENFNEAFDATAFSVDILAFNDNQNAAVENEFKDMTFEKDTTTGAVTVPTLDSTVAPYGMTITVPETQKDKVVINDNTISLAEGVEFAMVDVTVGVTGSTKTKNEKVYIIPAGKTPAYGNIGLHTTDDGKDAFSYTAPTGETEADITAAKTELNNKFATYVTNNKDNILTDIATALSIALDNSKAAELPHFADALDFDGDTTKLTLAEYRIYRLLMTGTDSVHTFTAVNEARNK